MNADPCARVYGLAALDALSRMSVPAPMPGAAAACRVVDGGARGDCFAHVLALSDALDGAGRVVKHEGRARR